MSKLLGVLVAGLCATAALAQPGGTIGSPSAGSNAAARLGSNASTGDRDAGAVDASRLDPARAQDRLAAAQGRDVVRQLGPGDRLDRFAQSDDDRSYSRGDRDERSSLRRDREEHGRPIMRHDRARRLHGARERREERGRPYLYRTSHREAMR